MNDASSKHNDVNAVANTSLSHRLNLVWLMYEILFITNSLPKNLGVAYTHRNMVVQ